MAEKQSSPLLHELARRLKSVREERHLTLQEVYDATGVHVSRVESGRRSVALLTVAMLCRYYQVQLAQIVDGIEQLIEDPRRQ
ncbi:helix-turn-helix domain-containing protein [Hymenobacter aranciens]|uniref:helix-turn-helix domain-containing protein n=1 Tax=Hymenobacter aranciens TaxID=3063996 RepID=UPI0035100056